MRNDIKKNASLLKVLSVDTRLRIILLLKGRALCVNALASKLEVTQGAVSQHLRVMREAGLVTDEKRGYFVHYRLNEKVLKSLQEDVRRILEPCLDSGKTAACCGKTSRK